ncbi:hypothetical protein [Endothiovibrio diazotrophicus]
MSERRHDEEHRAKRDRLLVGVLSGLVLFYWLGRRLGLGERHPP